MNEVQWACFALGRIVIQCLLEHEGTNCFKCIFKVVFNVKTKMQIIFELKWASIATTTIVFVILDYQLFSSLCARVPARVCC